MAQIREFESTTESYFILDGVSYPKVYEAMLDNGYSDTKIKLVGTNRDTTQLVFSTEYTNIRVDDVSFDTALEAISRLNQIVFSKGGGSGTGGATNVITEDSDTVAFTGNGTAVTPLKAEVKSDGLDYIPLTGTEEGKPITGPIEFIFPNGIDNTTFNTDSYQTFNITTTWTNPDDSITNYGYVNIAGSDVEIGHAYDGSSGNFLIVGSEHIYLADRNNSKGLVGEAYYGVNYDDLTYVQRRYVDQANSYSTEETKTALGLKVDKIAGKGLSESDFTSAEKTKLSEIETGANNYVLPATSGTILGGVKEVYLTQSAYDALTPKLTDVKYHIEKI